MGPYTTSWSYAVDSGSTETDITGSFEAWSTNNLNPVSQLLFNQDLPTIPVNYTLSVALNAVSVPEPTMIALIGLGILGIGTAQRRKIRTQLTV
ncbi:PEP-CTERM protein-sorting domain-containing protein [Nitrosomonas eutropha]|uniref:PEP-CTERM protein-sorting domain-containing protein n=1 Tax=Nitrosomonas eutropha TaxID=916 RepID=A0A1I7HB44_9PROT|nr:PEP-CTERM protein-sorting domain-containing protein [Nitrosomonas eutropha]